MHSSVTRNAYTQEIHPWNFFIPDGANELLLGTFPTEEKSRKQPFFYCSPTNRLWEVFSNIATIPIGTLSESTALKERENVLHKLKLDELRNSKLQKHKLLAQKLKLFESNSHVDKNFLKIPYFIACSKLGLL